jgi:hypothetical protein
MYLLHAHRVATLMPAPTSRLFGTWIELVFIHTMGPLGMTLDLEERNSVQDEGENPPPNSDTCESEPEHNRIFVRPR